MHKDDFNQSSQACTDPEPTAGTCCKLFVVMCVVAFINFLLRLKVFDIVVLHVMASPYTLMI